MYSRELLLAIDKARELLLAMMAGSRCHASRIALSLSCISMMAGSRCHASLALPRPSPH
jgi:hypothetical protein